MPYGAWAELFESQCTYRCVVLPDSHVDRRRHCRFVGSQCTYRCVVLPDAGAPGVGVSYGRRLNAPTGAWCSLTSADGILFDIYGLNAPTGAWCSLTRELPRSVLSLLSLNAPTGAWCSLTLISQVPRGMSPTSQCTYRCVVLPDPCPRERRYDATSRARSATGPGSTPPDRPAPGPE